jgi:spore germination protein YaaH
MVTNPPVAEVLVRLSEVEALAATGAKVQVGQSVLLAGTEPIRLGLPFDRPVTLPISYVVDGVATEPVWTQEVRAVEGGSVELVIEQPWRDPQPVDDQIIMAWQAGGATEEYLEQLRAAPALTVTSPRWWSLDGDGFLVSETDPEFVAAAHELGIEVWPYLVNGFERARTRRLLGDPRNRRSVAAQLSGEAQLAGVDGINVDFEAFSFVDRDNFTAFIEELSTFVDAWGGVVSVDITARTRSFSTLSESRGSLYDRRALAEAADYIALMAYDEHTRVNPAGPTASEDWAEEAVYWLLRHVDPHQVLLGVPFYSRIWDPEDLFKPATATIGTVVELAEANRRTFDPVFDLDRIELDDGRFMWAEDYDNLRNRLAFARRTGLAGTAAWRLGFDTPEVWEVYESVVGSR